MKTLRDLLLRLDSMDLRVGQYGENLKVLNSLLTMSTSISRESNFSSRLQQSGMSGPTTYDPTDFHKTIDRFNLDLSLRSNVANNTIVDANEGLDASLDNDDDCNDHQSGINSTIATTATTTVSAVAAAVVAGAAASATPCHVTTAATTNSADTNVVSSYASIVSRPPAAVDTATNSNSISNNNMTHATATHSVASTSKNVIVQDAVQDCRLKVVNRNRTLRQRQPTSDVTMKSFYVTPFDIEQTEEDVIEYLRETMNVDNSTLNCVKLVPRNRNVNELTFVSFKLSVSEDLVSVISDPFYWPEGVEVREFQPKNGSFPNRVVSI